MHTDFDGLKVSMIGCPTVHFEKTTFEGDTAAAKFTDLHTSLQMHLPSVVDLQDILRELKSFQSFWQYGFPDMQAYCLANPVMKQNGDLLFELQLHGQQRHLIGGRSVSRMHSVSSRECLFTIS